MKLLHIWIEKFRDIIQQGLAVDNEFKIKISVPDGNSFGFYDGQGNQVHGATPNHCRKIFYRKFSFERNIYHSAPNGDSPIQSVSALVGENASGKSSIMECVYRHADQFNHQNTEGRYFLLVFFDDDRQAIVVRTRDIWLLGAENKKMDIRDSEGFEEYVFPLSEAADALSTQPQGITKMISVYQDHREETLYEYKTMALSAIPINMERKNFRNSFAGVFDFLCEFPEFGAEGNHIVFYLKDQKSREKELYFRQIDLTPDEYKDFFLRKLSQLLFGTLRDYLYHEKSEVMRDGTLLKRPEEEFLRQEDKTCAEVLSFCTFDYPRSDSSSLVKTIWGNPPESDIAKAVAFFRKSTYVYMGKSWYDRYLDAVERLFSELYKVDALYFTALYKLSLPVENAFRHVIRAFDECITCGDEGHQWANGIVADFEWFSAGQRQISLMFSGLFQRLKEENADEKERDLILLFDEPEMHMHPEAGRYFIEILNNALTHFQSAGLLKSCQVILSTHSPFLIQSLSHYPASIALTKNNHKQVTISDFQDLQSLRLPGRPNYSFNLVMYHVFGVPTVELHIELYAFLQNKGSTEMSIMACDNYITRQTHIYNATKHAKKWNYGNRTYKTLPTFIRNAIDHPSDEDPQKSYTTKELICSIELLIKLCNDAKLL